MTAGTTNSATVVFDPWSALLDLLNSDARSAWPLAAGARADVLRPPRVGPRGTLVGDGEPALELALRSAALRVGFWLGWISIFVVAAGLALDGGAKHRWLLVGLTLAAATANTAAMLVPWQEWLPTRRGRVLLDLWSGGLIAFVALPVYAGGTNFALLLFLAIPFIAVVQVGWRRGFWLATSAGTCVLAAALIPLSVGATAMRLSLVAVAVAVALVLARTIRREAAAHNQAAARAELEHTLATEANHRIKNNLQTVTDLLLLGRPENGDGRAFDETAARIRSIATVHRLLTEAEDAVDAGALLESIAEGAPVPVLVEAEWVALDATTAQKLGIVANELITNAFQHGASPIVVQLAGRRRIRLRVDDSGNGIESSTGLGLELVRRMVEQGLRGRFELTALPGGGTRAEVVFPGEPK
jgi:two-component sensor histidine kinase